MAKKYIVSLSDPERDKLSKMINAGRSSARAINHARILLKADINGPHAAWTDAQIQDALEISPSTIERVRQRFVEEGIDAALTPRRRTNYRHRRLDGEQEAHLIALACSKPPAGRQRWTLRLLADQMVELDYIESVSHETVRQTLKKK